MSADVLVAGEIYIDLVFAGFDSWPQPGQEAFARDFHREIGGGAAITSCGLATLGTRTALLGVIGEAEREWVAARLGERSVDTSMLAADADEPTGTTVAVTVPQDRAFFTYRGANKRFAQTIAAANFEGVRHVHLAWAVPWDCAPTLFARIHRSGATVSVDAGWHPEWLADPRAPGALRDADLVFLNEAEAAAMTAETGRNRVLRRIYRSELPAAAVKLGPDGAVMIAGGAIHSAPPVRVTPIDTTGAGDCFDAGFLHAWLQGGSPAICLAAGNLCGALSTEAYGGIAGFPTRERFHKELGL